jgi:hypothetical protein
MSLVPSFDVIELLPPGGEDRLRALRQHSHDLNKLIPKFEEKFEANNAKIEAEQRLKRLTDHPHHGGAICSRATAVSSNSKNWFRS